MRLVTEDAAGRWGGPRFSRAPWLSLSQYFLIISHQGRKQIADDPPRAGLDLDRHRHSRRELDGSALDLHLAPVEADPRGIDELLPLGLTRRAFRAGGLIPRLFLMPVAGDGVARNAQHIAMQQPVAGEIEGIDLDRGALSGDNETDIAVRHHRLDLEIGIKRYHNCQR